MLKHEYIECLCDSEQHVLRFSYDPEDNEIYTSVHLAPRPWYSRIKPAIKYLFGYHCGYGQWDCTLIGEKEAKKLSDLLDRVILKKE